MREETKERRVNHTRLQSDASLHLFHKFNVGTQSLHHRQNILSSSINTNPLRQPLGCYPPNSQMIDCTDFDAQIHNKKPNPNQYAMHCTNRCVDYFFHFSCLVWRDGLSPFIFLKYFAFAFGCAICGRIVDTSVIVGTAVLFKIFPIRFWYDNECRLVINDSVIESHCPNNTMRILFFDRTMSTDASA